MEKLDARKRYTQMMLKQSFLKLLQQKPVNRITVKEVCALAQLNRATFYAHYSDCFALKESIENELIVAFEKSLRYVNSFDVTALIEAIYDMVEQNQEACRVLILDDPGSAVLMRMIALAKEDSLAYWRRELPEASVTMAEAEGYLASSLKVMERQLALIPITPETERLCYEFKGRCGEDEYIVYIDAQTGAEQQIFVIINTENGQLTA